jgi:hypothetical protein
MKKPYYIEYYERFKAEKGGKRKHDLLEIVRFITSKYGLVPPLDRYSLVRHIEADLLENKDLWENHTVEIKSKRK